MSDHDTDASHDDLSNLSGFFFYSFIVHPATAWIMKPGRFERKKSIMYAITFLVALAAIKTGLEMQQRGPNYYSMLGINRGSNPLEIKRAFKKLSLQLHPDKNPSPDANQQFDTIKQAYDVIMDLELKDVYNKFGPAGIKANKRFDEYQFLLEVAIYYVSYGMVAFILTMGKKNSESRNWILTGLISMLVIEVAIMTAESNPIPLWLFPRLTEHEVVWLLHTLFPAFMNGCRSIGTYLYVDIDRQTRQFLLALSEQNKDILLVLRDIQIGVQNIQATGGGAPRLATSSGSTPAAKALPTGKLKELQDRLRVSNTSVAQAVNVLKGENKSSNMNLGFYMMVLGYIALSYIFN